MRTAITNIIISAARSCSAPASRCSPGMMKVDRRTALTGALAGGAAVLLPAPLLARGARAPSPPLDSQGEPRWGKGFEGQRKADLGDGTFLNPIVAGDHPDPTILKDGADYYMTFS